MLKCFYLLMTIPFLTQCEGREPVNNLKTNLGPNGNAIVKQEFDLYKAKPKDQHCSREGTGRRVIFTGYSLFQSFRYNISGTIVEAMADTKLWPSVVSLDEFNPTDETSIGHKSILPQGSHGGFAAQRQLKIDGRDVTVCLILLEVRWDLAAAIVLDEASRFGPQSIIMTGGGVTDKAFIGQFEGGAVNDALAMAGYSTTGEPLPDNVPVKPDYYTPSPILLPSEPGVRSPIPMKWNSVKLAALTQGIAATIPYQNEQRLFSSVGYTHARPSNNYLCNNVSYVTLSAIAGVHIKLAGGQIDLGVFDELSRAVDTAGFYHIPNTYTDAAKTMLGWSKFFAKVMLVTPTP
jgi:hypothetical protein